ncbi:hypothetical protein POM88_033718 [Heracleum sosnowskyi]|uniref:RRM domain-containing protein n=1 Tax=Heracleum sosnowskyi TaxID=360622 RepID=A0AAD8HI13_9APIA|nr:hypothetical protein POM88_033718 [Heracleum sosnowskyi]
MATDNKVFVGRLTDISEASVQSYFKNFDSNVDVRFTSSGGFAFCSFSDISIVNRVLNQPTHVIENREVDVKKYIPRLQLNDSPSTMSKRVYVQEIPYKSTLTYNDFVDFFYNPTVVQQKIAAVIILEQEKPIGLGFISAPLQNFPPQTSTINLILRSEVAKLVETIRLAHCNWSSAVLNDPHGGITGMQLSSLRDVHHYFKPARRLCKVLQLTSLPLPPRVYSKNFDIHDMAMCDYTVVTLEQDRIRGLCGFGLVPVPRNFNLMGKPDLMIQIQIKMLVGKMNHIIRHGRYPNEDEQQSLAANCGVHGADFGTDVRFGPGATSSGLGSHNSDFWDMTKSTAEHNVQQPQLATLCGAHGARSGVHFGGSSSSGLGSRTSDFRLNTEQLAPFHGVYGAGAGFGGASVSGLGGRSLDFVVMARNTTENSEPQSPLGALNGADGAGSAVGLGATSSGLGSLNSDVGVIERNKAENSEQQAGVNGACGAGSGGALGS